MLTFEGNPSLGTQAIVEKLMVSNYTMTLARA